MFSKDSQVLALLLPSKGRILDLVLTLLFVPLKSPKGFKCVFVVCANYNSFFLFLLKFFFRSKAHFFDERSLPWKGMTGAYNYAFQEADKLGAKWVALWADDLLPNDPNWLSRLFQILTLPDFHFGIFSSDEGNHKTRYGWNVEAGFPCAHFYVAAISALPGYLLNPKLRAYVGDNEIAVSLKKKGTPIHLIPIKVIHQPTANHTRAVNTSNYKTDLEIFYTIHPEMRGQLDAIVLRGEVHDDSCRFIVDTGALLRFEEGVNKLNYSEFSKTATIMKPRLFIRLIGRLRANWNRLVLAPYRIKGWATRRLVRP